MSQENKEVKPRKNKRQYFTKETEDAILLYNQLEDIQERNKLYDEKIKYPFDKLVENIIHTFKFYHMDSDSIEDLKYEVISFLLQKLDKYNDSLGKAYSYFGTIAKRYLIVYNQKNYKSKVSKVRLAAVLMLFPSWTRIKSSARRTIIRTANIETLARSEK